MCLQNQYYPLVYLNNGKRKIMFQYGIKVIDRDTFDMVYNTKHQFNLAKVGLSRWTCLNQMFKKEDVKEPEPFYQSP